MLILSINSGSSSLKFKLIKFNNKIHFNLAEGYIDAINQKNCNFKFKIDNELKQENPIKIKNYQEAITLALKTLLKSNVIENLDKITAVGHRVVHGGSKFQKEIIATSKILKELKNLNDLAPLHNPANIKGILACQKLLKKTPQILVFDTSYYRNLEEKAYLYGLPLELYKKYQIRKYGFHGISHEYICKETKKLLKKQNTKIISCHLGNGSSITASKNLKAVDTSMGFSPLDGIPMGTRSGSIDPSIIFYMEEKLKFSKAKIKEILLHESGLKGLSEISSDMREIYYQSLKGNKKAINTIDIYAYKIAKKISSYIASLNGLDAITFTGGIGENAFYLREKVIKYLNFLEAYISKPENKRNAKIISMPSSKVKIYVIKTNEELEIALKVKNLLTKI